MSNSKEKRRKQLAVELSTGLGVVECNLESSEILVSNDSGVASAGQEGKRWFIYMVATEKGKLYTGITTDVKRRFSEHLNTHLGHSALGAKYFRSDRPIRVVYCEEAESRSTATKREREIKSMSAAVKRRLVRPG